MRVVLLVLLGILLAPTLAPYDPMQTHPAAAYLPPTWEYLLGTDQLGRDVLSRVLYGGQQSVFLAVGASSLALTVGLSVGVGLASAVSRRPGVVRIVIMANDTLRTLPTILIATAILTILGNTTTNLLIAIGISQTSITLEWARTRAEQQSRLQHTEAAQALGATPLHIAIHHIVPMLIPEIKHYTILLLQTSLLTTTALTFIGFGTILGTPEWGTMIREGREAFRTAPWITIAPGTAITGISLWLLSMTSDKHE